MDRSLFDTGSDRAPWVLHATCLTCLDMTQHQSSRPRDGSRWGPSTRYAREFISSTVVGGLFIVAPVYLALLLLLKAMQSVATLMEPLAALFPAWIPAQELFSLGLVLVVCFLVGMSVRTRTGHAIRERAERVFLEKLPGYSLLRSLTQRLAGDSDENAWKPAMVEIEDALVPGFIIEEHDDGQYTVFVPSVPTPLAGAVYVLGRERVHILDVPFTQAINLAMGFRVERPRGRDATERPARLSECAAQAG